MIFSNLFNKLLRFIFKSKVFDITSGFIVGNKSNFSINSFKRHSYGEYFIDVVGSLLNSNVNIIEGIGVEECMDDEISVTVIATGFNVNKNIGPAKPITPKIYEL